MDDSRKLLSMKDLCGTHDALSQVILLAICQLSGKGSFSFRINYDDAHEKMQVTEITRRSAEGPEGLQRAFAKMGTPLDLATVTRTDTEAEKDYEGISHATAKPITEWTVSVSVRQFLKSCLGDRPVEVGYHSAATAVAAR